MALHRRPLPVEVEQGVSGELPGFVVRHEEEVVDEELALSFEDDQHHATRGAPGVCRVDDFVKPGPGFLRGPSGRTAQVRLRQILEAVVRLQAQRIADPTGLEEREEGHLLDADA